MRDVQHIMNNTLRENLSCSQQPLSQISQFLPKILFVGVEMRRVVLGAEIGGQVRTAWAACTHMVMLCVTTNHSRHFIPSTSPI